MKFYLISDNVDTQLGMRLAGIDGIVVHEYDEVKQALIRASENPEIAIILITEKLSSLCKDIVFSIKQDNTNHTLIEEIPDRHGMGRSEGAIAKYIRESIGINIE